MRKKILTLIALLTIGIASVNAVPVNPKHHVVIMPDGKKITLVGHGDEYHNFITTTDGYTVVKAEDGCYHYAQLAGGKLAATDIIAHDVEERSTEERAFTASLEKNIQPTVASSLKRLKYIGDTSNSETSPGDEPLIKKISGVNKDKFRGLLILVNFSDREFRLGDQRTHEVMDSLMNVEGLSRYYDDELGYQYCTGSLYDYFSDNSYGIFKPQFDVVGPVTITKSQTYPQKVNNSWSLTKEVLDAIDSDVDFSKYDSDNDGFVDMFYIVYAGSPSSNSGNNADYLWPHASSLQGNNFTKNGKKFARYACSTELYGWESQNDLQLNGIGTICHEFSHVLGYMDHYDTSDAGTNEQPLSWDVMAGGCYNGYYSRTPAGYNAYERITGDFLSPTIISTEDIGETVTLPSLASEAKAYKLNTKQKNEFFLIENRQKDKWDSFLPGTGMLLWHVDSTNVAAWSSNNVNSDESHLYFRLVRAKGYTGSDTGADPFPGTKKVTMITNASTPANLLSNSGLTSDIGIFKISETNREISFNIQSATKTLPEGYVFYESFDDCNGTGGNDDIFSTAMKTSVLYTDCSGWTYKTGVGCNQCARFGSNSITRESVITPEITLDANKIYTLSFLAAPYYTDGTALQISVSSGNAKISNDSVANDASGASKVVTMTKNQWTHYSFTITGSGAQNIKFYGNTSAAKRFLLDEVIVKEYTKQVDGIVEVKNEEYGDKKPVYYNLSGQRVNANAKGLVIVNGKKFFINK